MHTKLVRSIATLHIGLAFLTGCHPTKPFYMGETGDLSHYIDTASRIEYPDLQSEPLPEASQTMEPYSIDNQKYEFLDLTLEECLAYALVNTKLVRAVPGSNLQSGDIASAILSSPSSQLSTAYDPAITASTANTQAHVVDQNGNRVQARGAAKANQVGGVEDALSEFDAQFSSFVGYNTTDRPRNVGGGNIFNPQFFQANDGTAQSAISKRMATGGVVTARSQSIYSFNNIPSPGIGRQSPSDYTQILEMQIQHPLLRGRGTLVNRIPVVLARVNEDISLGQYEERIRNLSKEVEVAYWELYCSYWNVETAKIARDNSLKVWRSANNRYSAGTETTGAEAQAKAQYHQFEAALMIALNGASVPGADPGVTGRERRLRHLMGWAATDGRLIRPSDRPNVAPTEFDWNTIVGEALTRNIELRQQKWLIKTRELELISAKNQVLPDVNISALYRWLGVGNSYNSRSGSPTRFPIGDQSAIDSLVGGDFQEAAFRLEFTPATFGSRRQLANVRNSQLTLAREAEVLREKEIGLMHLLSDQVNLLKSHFELMNQKLNQWNDSERDAFYWNVRYEEGAEQTQSVALDNLLRAQERRARAQAEYYRAVCEYNKSIVQIHLLKGSLLEYNNICMQEGPWPTKAYEDATDHARRRDAARYLDYGASRPKVISQGPYQQHLGNVNEGAEFNPAKHEMPELEPVPANPSTDKSEKQLDKIPEEDIPALPERKKVPTPEKDPPDVKTLNKTNRLPTAALNRSEQQSVETTRASSSVIRQAGYIQPTASTPANVLR